MARAGIAAGAQGIIVEVHSCPEKALCDGPQALLPIEFTRLMQQLRHIAAAVGRSVVEPASHSVGAASALRATRAGPGRG